MPQRGQNPAYHPPSAPVRLPSPAWLRSLRPRLPARVRPALTWPRGWRRSPSTAPLSGYKTYERPPTGHAPAPSIAGCALPARYRPGRSRIDPARGPRSARALSRHSRPGASADGTGGWGRGAWHTIIPEAASPRSDRCQAHTLPSNNPATRSTSAMLFNASRERPYSPRDIPLHLFELFGLIFNYGLDQIADRQHADDVAS